MKKSKPKQLQGVKSWKHCIPQRNFEAWLTSSVQVWEDTAWKIPLWTLKAKQKIIVNCFLWYYQQRALFAKCLHSHRNGYVTVAECKIRRGGWQESNLRGLWTSCFRVALIKLNVFHVFLSRKDTLRRDCLSSGFMFVTL